MGDTSNTGAAIIDTEFLLDHTDIQMIKENIKSSCGLFDLMTFAKAVVERNDQERFHRLNDR